MNQTFVMCKPDAVERRLVGEIVSRLERKGFTLVAAQLRSVDKATAEEHYAEHVDKPFYPSLREFITGGPLVAMVLAGDSAVDVVRVMNGATDARKAEPGTVRGDLALSTSENLVHASDSAESAVREIDLWFPALA